MSDTTEETDTATQEAPPLLEPAPEPKAPTTGTAERILDITFGLATFAAETARRAAEKIQEQAPSVLKDLEEKGRPLRERFLGPLGQASVFSQGSEVPPAASAPIDALERRVRELEAQVETPTAPSPPSTPVNETPAEEATVLPDDAPVSLADSAYAVSETEEEVAREAAEESTASETENTENKTNNPTGEDT